MPLYNIEAKTQDGQRIAAVREAVNREILIDSLQKEGYVVLSVNIATSSEQIKSKRHFTHAGVRTGDLMIFARQLGVMLDGGVTLNSALDAIKKQTDSKLFFKVLVDIQKQVLAGNTLAQALGRFPKYFSALWVSMIETGEASGKLDFVLTRLARYLEIKLNFRNTIITSLFYPIILFVAAVGALIFFVMKIIPTLTSLFESFSVELPLITKITISVSDVLRTKFLFLFLGISLIAILIWQIQRVGVINKRMWKALFRIPIFGNLLKVLVVEKFLSQMGVLVESGVPILHSLEIAHRSTENPILKDIVNSIKNAVQGGSSLSRPMETSDFFAPMVIQMVSAGEESGSLAMMLEKISNFYEDYTRTFLERFSRIFEPIMIIVMGVFVGATVISLYLPIFQIATLGGGIAR